MCILPECSPICCSHYGFNCMRHSYTPYSFGGYALIISFPVDAHGVRTLNRSLSNANSLPFSRLPSAYYAALASLLWRRQLLLLRSLHPRTVSVPIPLPPLPCRFRWAARSRRRLTPSVHRLRPRRCPELFRIPLVTNYHFAYMFIHVHFFHAHSWRITNKIDTLRWWRSLADSSTPLGQAIVWC